ncbi:MAG TPA: hypothetical protein ENJ16_01270 [Planctomycetaceae bacterium]|nr:hypothetical protein [Planctomycetaceae bacterium]
MRFLLDVCASSRALYAFLEEDGHDVVSVVARDLTASDSDILAMALEEDRILVTEDKDFGELVFVQRASHGPIVRLVELTVTEQVAAMRDLLDHHSSQLTGRVLITVSRGRVRIRR